MFLLSFIITIISDFNLIKINNKKIIKFDYLNFLIKIDL